MQTHKQKHRSKTAKKKNQKRNSTIYNRTTQSLKHFQIPHIQAMHPQHPTQPKHKIPNSQNTLAIQHTKNSNHSSENNRRPRRTGFTNPNWQSARAAATAGTLIGTLQSSNWRSTRNGRTRKRKQSQWKRGERERERVVPIGSKPKAAEVKQQRYEEGEEMIQGFGKREREKERREEERNWESENEP